MRDVMLIFHIIGVAMGLGASMASYFLGMAAKLMDEKEANSFLIKTLYLNKMGKIGLLVLIITGGYLMTPYWSLLLGMEFLVIKLVLVLVIIGLVGMMTVFSKKAKNTDSKEALQKAIMTSRIMLITLLMIIVLAVLTFH